MPENQKKIDTIFEKKPDQWGLRGDPFLWDDLKKNLSGFAWPESAEELEKNLEINFLELAGVPVCQKGHIYIGKYDHKGMSSGYVHIDYWRDNLFPLILKRFDQENISEQMSKLVKSTIEGLYFTLYLGDVDLGNAIVTVQRDMSLVAAVQDRGDGKLLSSIYRPLCEKSAGYLVALSTNPSDEGSVCSRPNNWEFALDSSAGAGNIYASERGEAYLSFWEYGLGRLRGERTVSEWVAQQKLKPLCKDQVEVFFVKNTSPHIVNRPTGLINYRCSD